MELGRTDVIEGCEVAEEKREKRVLIGFRTTEKGYRPLRDPCPTCLASNAIQRSSSFRARTIREREQDDTLSFPRILSFANPTMRKISGKKIWLFRVKKKRILSFGNCLSFSLIPWFHIRGVVIVNIIFAFLEENRAIAMDGGRFLSFRF